MKPKMQLSTFVFISVTVHVILLAVLPLSPPALRTSGEIYQIVSVFEDTGNFAQTPPHSFEQQSEWLETLERIDSAPVLDESKPENQSTARSITVPEIATSGIDAYFTEKLAQPLLEDSLTLDDKKLPLIPPELSDIAASLDWQTNAAPHASSTPDAADQKSAVVIPPELDNPPPDADSEIEGPAGARAVIFKPKPPLTTVDTSATITLKFWVFPDGTVGKIIPMKKSNAELERVAINYLKQWRFSPLPREQKQEDQWGIIPVKFTLD